MTAAEVFKESEDHMSKSIDATRREMNTVRTGKATPGLLENIKVEYYGSLMPLNQIATVSAPEPRLLTVTPFDKSAMGDIEKAIQGSELGLNPANDGNIIRIPIPQLNEERRRDLVKVVRNMVEQGRVAIRNVRHHANDKLKNLEKSGDLSEDEAKREHKRIQDLTDQHIKALDELLKTKEADVLEV
jgi:ribosome recycling factor